MRLNNWLAIISAVCLVLPAFGQDPLLGKGRGGGSGSSNSKPATKPSNNNSDRNKPARTEPAPRNTGRQDQNRNQNGQTSRGSSGGGFTIDLGRPQQRRDSRSGQVRYGTTNNQRVDRQQPIVIESLPNRGTAAYQARREENIRPVERYRSGYYHYRNDWRDDNFSYPYYQFRYNDRCAISPWYYYPSLPAYVDYSRVDFRIGSFSFSFGSSRPWTYRDRYDTRSDSYELDNTVRDLVRVYERHDLRALGRLVPDRARVVIKTDCDRPYSISGNDFYDMITDAIESTRTTDYQILEVRDGRGCAQVTAKHCFTDAWGRRSFVYHRYSLEFDRYNFVIAEFETSGNAW